MDTKKILQKEKPQAPKKEVPAKVAADKSSKKGSKDWPANKGSVFAS